MSRRMRHIKQCLIITIWITISIHVSIAQESNYRLIEHLTVDNGLPSNHVYASLMDSDGFLWFATDRGVVRYDGNEMKVYTTKDGLPRSDVYDLKEDKKGRIWLFSIADEMCYIFKGAVHTKKVKDSDKNIYMLGFTEDEIGIRFISTNHGYCEEQETHIKCIDAHYVIKDKASQYRGGHHTINTSSVNSAKHYYYTPEKRIQKIHTTEIISKRFAYQVYYGDALIFYNSYDNTISEVRRDSIQILLTLDHDDKNNIISIKKGHENVSITLKSKVVIYDYTSKTCETINFQEIGITTPHNSIYKMHDLLISCSMTDGFKVYQKGNQKTVKKHLDVKRGSHDFKYKIKAKDEIFFISDKSSIVGINELMESSVYDMPDINEQTGKILSAYKDDYDNICLITERGYSLKYEFRKRRLILVNKTIIELENSMPTGVYNFRIINDTLAYGNNHRGLFQFTIMNNGIKGTRIYDGTVKDYYYKSPEEIILLTPTKVIEFDTGSRKHETIHSEYDFTWMKEIDSTIFVSTIQQGLYELKPSNNELIEVIPHTSVIDISKTSSIIYAASTNGLYALDSELEILDIYRQKDGLITNNLNIVDHFNDQVLIGSNDEVQLLNENYSRQEILSPRLYQESDKTLYNVSSNSFLLKEDRSIYLKYGFCNYYNKDIYKLTLNITGDALLVREEFEGDVNLSNLESGSYAVLVDLVNKYTNKVEDTIETNIKVTPFWYESIWLKILGIILFLLAVYMFVNWRIQVNQNKILEQASIESEFARLELSALQSQMNPHFVFNALNSIQNLIGENRVVEANKYLVKFSSLMRSFLKHADLNVTSLEDEIELNRNYLDLEKLRFKEELEYYISVDDSIDQVYTVVPTVMIQPFLENAIRHGIFHKQGMGRIDLQFIKLDDGLKITIKDNGIGISASEKINRESRVDHESRGIQLLNRKKELLKILEGLNVDMVINEIEMDGKVEGTEVVLTVKMEKEI